MACGSKFEKALPLARSLQLADNRGATILVVDDVEEVLDGIEKLLQVDGYTVEAVRSVERAVECAQRKAPELILVNLDGSADVVIAAAERIRQQARLDSNLPIVLFCIDSVDEGAEIHIGGHVYVTRPDNFNQLRAFMRRLLEGQPAGSGGALVKNPSGGPVRS